MALRFEDLTPEQKIALMKWATEELKCGLCGAPYAKTRAQMLEEAALRKESLADTHERILSAHWKVCPEIPH